MRLLSFIFAQCDVKNKKPRISEVSGADIKKNLKPFLGRLHGQRSYLRWYVNAKPKVRPIVLDSAT